MGETKIRRESDPEELRIFMRRVLDDARALEKMLEDNLFETDVTRIGAEQEMFLVDAAMRPAPLAMEILETIEDPRFTTELARFNLEANLDPLVLEGDALSQLEAQLDQVLGVAREGARKLGADVVLTGILPTLDKNDLRLDNMTPLPRYAALSDAVRQLRGSDFEFHIKGRDELTLRHDTVMPEACNTSFQVHFQVKPSDFARLYNIAQTLTAPVLAAATNSPMLFGRRLWSETRIAVFRQSVDTRSHASHHRQQPPRVSFGEHWIDDSVLEIIREDIARFRLLISTQIEEDSLAVLEEGRIPKLKALCLHNGTVYRWNRPCYGISEGKPHLRIENRILPAGPSVLDEVANTALWLGGIKGLAEDFGDIRKHIAFDAIKESFLATARRGLDAQIDWLDGRSAPAREVLLEDLIPRARRGLRALGVSADDADHYLDVIEERVGSLRTGSRWLMGSLQSFGQSAPKSEQMASLTAAMLFNQVEGRPVHEWELASLRNGGTRERHYSKVGSLMTTDLFTVNETDVIDLAASLMDWRHIRHVPVEDNRHHLVGLVTHRNLLRILTRHHGKPQQPIAVRDIMERDVVTVEPSTNTLDAIGLMREHRVACLPVVENGALVGILSERDFMRIFGDLLEEFLGRV